MPIRQRHVAMQAFSFRRLLAAHPERYNLVVDSGRVRAVLLRIAADIDELERRAVTRNA